MVGAFLKPSRGRRNKPIHSIPNSVAQALGEELYKLLLYNTRRKVRHRCKHAEAFYSLCSNWQGIVTVLLNLSSFVQSRNTQNDERKRFLEPEVATLPRTAPRQPPLQRLGLGRLSGKCYNELPTGSVSACLIPVAVGGPATAFSRRSVKTGGNRNASPGSTPSLSGLPIVHAA